MKSKWLFPAALMLIAAGAFIFRLPKLDFRPMHGDEAIQADKFRALWEERTWIYDPKEYHGPTLNYFTAVPMWATRARDFAHSTEFTYRIVPVCFGAGLIPLMLLTARGLGRRSTLCAAALLAISPAMVFYSRYYIQEMLLVFFTFAAIAFGWRYALTRKGYNAVLAGLALGLAFATKETWILSLAAIGFAMVAARLWSRLIDPPANAPPHGGPAPVLIGALAPANAKRDLLWLGAAIVSGLVIASVCFSAFFTHLRGIPDSFATYLNYLRRGTQESGHEHPFNYYFRVLFYWVYGRHTFSEGFIAALAVVGLVSSLWKRGITIRGYYNSFTGQLHESNPALVRFLSFYTICITLLYSLLRYKTPWCAINFLFPMILLAGVGAVSFVQMTRHRYAKPVVGCLLLVPTFYLARQAYEMNFTLKYVADARLNPHVYGHPLLQTVDAARRVQDLARVSPEKQAMLVLLVSPTGDIWPFPWYLRGFSRVGTFPSVGPGTLPAGVRPSVVIATMDARPGVDALLGVDDADAGKKPLAQQYVIDHHGLRPGFPVAMYVRGDLWNAYLRSRGLTPE